MSILPVPVREDAPDVRPLAFALARVPLDWWAPLLPGETLEEARARRAAAADIFDELLHEAAAAAVGGGR